MHKEPAEGHVRGCYGGHRLGVYRYSKGQSSIKRVLSNLLLIIFLKAKIPAELRVVGERVYTAGTKRIWASLDSIAVDAGKYLNWKMGKTCKQVSASSSYSSSVVDLATLIFRWNLI